MSTDPKETHEVQLPYATIDGKVLSKDDFTNWIQGKINEALAPKLRQNDQLRTELEQLAAVKSEYEKIKDEKESKNRTAAEQYQHELQKRDSQAEELKKQLLAQQQQAELVRQKWHNTHKREYVTQLATQAGAAKSAVADVALLYPSDSLVVEETQNGLRVKCVDPVTGMDRDPVEHMKAWLESKPHLREAPPRGVPISPSPAPSAQKQEIGSGMNAILSAMRAGHIPQG